MEEKLAKHLKYYELQTASAAQSCRPASLKELNNLAGDSEDESLNVDYLPPPVQARDESDNITLT